MKAYPLIAIPILLCCCTAKDPDAHSSERIGAAIDTSTAHPKPFRQDLPTIGLLMYDGVLTTEVTAPADVFTKPSADGERLFNVITVARSHEAVLTEEGLRIFPDHVFADCPDLDVLFVPSGYDMHAQVRDQELLRFIQEQDRKTRYTVSNCAGAQLIGESGIAAGRKIVTWIGGGEQLQKDYPDLLVQNDSVVTYVEDGKFSSSNGNLASYISALNLLEKMTSAEHRSFVESYLYLDRLQAWNK